MLYACIRYRHSTDMVIIDTYSTLNFYYALLTSQLCRLLKLPYISSLNGGHLPKRLEKSPKMSQLIFRNAFVNIAPSRFLKESFEKHGYHNIRYIPNTIEIKNYQFLKRDFTIPKLLWVRSFSKIYNPLLAIKVLRALKDKGLDASLCMVGPDSDGSLQNAKALAIHLGVSVTFTGKLTKKEWIQRSENYNVFINTTTIDNTPVSVIESMALGLPIVSTNVGGMPYLIAHGTHGLLVENNNVDAMVDAILILFEDPEKRDAMILNARALAESFDWERVKLGWKDVLIVD
jgi:glycosyltransferase involved in cell wall biosynthesis